MNKQLQVKQRLAKGFTLVELLIVVIILAILAAILVPQFASSTDDAKSSALDSTLSNMRGAIDLYYQQHGGRYPGAYTVDAAGASTATTTGTVPAQFIAQLTLYTDAKGHTQSTSDTTHKFGPYLKKNVLPSNPITGVNTLVGEIAGDLTMVGTNAGGGWKYDAKSGKFIADDTNTDPRSSTSAGYDER